MLWLSVICVIDFLKGQCVGLCSLWCFHTLTDKGNGRRTDRKNVKNVYPVMEVVSMAVNVDAEVIRSTYVPNK